MADIETLCEKVNSITPGKIACDKDKIYHFFISYRQATELDMSQGFFTGIKATCVDKTFSEEGDTPKVFLDVESLADGEQWAAGFVRGMLRTTVAVPLVTWYPDDTGSAGQMVGLATADKCDNVLLEWELTIALVNYPDSKMKSVFPVIHGGHDKRGYLDFPFEKMSKLPDSPSILTKARLVEICEKEGIPLTEADVTRSVRGTVNAILAYQGVKLAELGSVIIANKQCVLRLFDKGAAVLAQLPPDEEYYDDPSECAEDEDVDYEWEEDEEEVEEAAPDDVGNAPIDEEGHQTKWFTGSNAYSCNICGEDFWEGGSRFRCGYCDYDVCQNCAANGY